MFVEVGEKAKWNAPTYEAAHQELKDLSRSVGEYTQLMIEEGGMGIYLIKTGGENAIGSDYHVGERQHPHHSAAGKTILAYLPEERVHEIIDEHGLPPQTEHTITDRAELLASLEQIREQGYALSNEEAAIGIRAVGAPVLDPQRAVLSAISIPGPIKRITDEKFTEELPDRLMGAANIIEIQLNNHQ